MKLFPRLNTLFQKRNSPDERSARRIILIVLGVALTAASLLFIFDINPTLMLTLIFFMGGAFYLAYRGILMPATVLVPALALIFFSYLMWINQGIRDTAIIGLPIVIVSASLMSRRGFGTVIFGVLSLGVVLALWLAETQGVLPASRVLENTSRDYLAVAIGIVIVTAMQWILIHLLNENIRDARVELRERKKLESSLRQREAILAIVARAAERLLESADWHEYSPTLLRELGEATLASHAYIFENHLDSDGILLTSQRFEWDVRRGQLEANNPFYQNIQVLEKGLEDWHESIRQGSVFYSATRDFPPEWHLSNPDIKTLLDMPIFTGEHLWGVIGFDDCERELAWSQAEIDALLAAAKMLGAAIQRQQAEQALRASQKELHAKNQELERFTYTVSHDLKSPLITIRGFLGYLEEDARRGDMERLQEDSRRIVEATDKMSRLLNELLELSRIGRIVNPPATVPFEEIVREALRLVEGRLAGIQVDVEPDLPEVRGDRARLVEAVQNLLDNAAKFMGDQKQPRIEVGARRDERPVVFFVKDNGVGIQPEYAEKIFGLFDKIDPRTEGTGIGLAIVKRILEVHGGSIWVESEPGAGAAFCFTLPAQEEETEPVKR